MSHRGNLADRLVSIPLLLAERPRSLREMAEHFHVSKRTIKRAIDALSVYHPIVEHSDGREIQYGYSNHQRFHPPPLTPSEVATLLLAQEAIAMTGLSYGSPFDQSARSMIAKVKASLPPPLRERLDALAPIYGTAAVPAKDFAPHAGTVDGLTTAAVERRRVRLRYYSMHRDATEERTVDPYSVYFDPDGATLKLIGFDHLRKRIVPFAIDHIRSLKITGESFERPAEFDLRQFLTSYCFNGIHGEPIRVRLRARGVTARVFAERMFHPSQQTIERTGGTEETTTIEMTVASGRGLLRFILGWGAEVEVLVPSELRREVASALKEALDRLQSDTKKNPQGGLQE